MDTSPPQNGGLRLRHLSGSRAGTATDLADSLIVGRRPDCGLPLDPHRDSLVSGRHARLVREPDGWWIEDLGSTNGTWLNGRRVEGRERLYHGDRTALGDPDHDGSATFELQWPGGPVRPPKPGPPAQAASGDGRPASGDGRPASGDSRSASAEESSVVCRCSACGARFPVPGSQVGRPAPCPSCGRSDIVRPSLSLGFGGGAAAGGRDGAQDGAKAGARDSADDGASVAATGTHPSASFGAEAPAGADDGESRPSGAFGRLFAGVGRMYTRLRERPKLRRKIAELEERRAALDRNLRAACASLGRSLWEAGQAEMGASPEAAELRKLTEERAGVRARMEEIAGKSAVVKTERDARLKECDAARAAAAGASGQADAALAEADKKAAAADAAARDQTRSLQEAARRAADALAKFAAEAGSAQPVPEDFPVRRQAALETAVGLLEPHRRTPAAADAVFAKLAEARAQARAAKEAAEAGRRALAAADARRSAAEADFRKREDEIAAGLERERARDAELDAGHRAKSAEAAERLMRDPASAAFSRSDAAPVRTALTELAALDGELEGLRNALRELGGDTVMDGKNES